MPKRKSWRCFHCDANFTDSNLARLHFGDSIIDRPACQIDAEQVRVLERQLAEYRAEDTELHRTIYRLQSEHREALKREEERGYARCMRDVTAIVPKLGGDPQTLTRILVEFGGDRIPSIVATSDSATDYKCPKCDVTFTVAADNDHALEPQRGHSCQ